MTTEAGPDKLIQQLAKMSEDVIMEEVTDESLVCEVSKTKKSIISNSQSNNNFCIGKNAKCNSFTLSVTSYFLYLVWLFAFCSYLNYN